MRTQQSGTVEIKWSQQPVGKLYELWTKIEMSTFIFAGAFLLILLIYSVSSYMRRMRRTRDYLEKIPGPPSLPILGNILQFQGSPEHGWNTFRAMGNKYYPTYKLIGIGIFMVNIRHPDDAEILLSSSKNISKGYIYSFLHDWFGTGLLTSTNRKWQQRRKILTPAFHFNVLREYVGTFDREGHRMVNELNFENGPVTVELVSFISKYTLNTICETAMGTSLSSMESSHEYFLKSYRKSIHDLGDVIIRRILRPWIHPDQIFSLTSAGRLQKQCLDIVRGFSKKIIGERQKYHESTNGIHLEIFNDNNEDTDITYRPSTKKLAMLDLLITAKKNGHMDNTGIWEEVETFMFEGHDTTAMGTCFTLLLLAEHTNIQQRVRDEVDEVLKKCEGHMGIAELQQLPYLERCIKEALRLYPSVPFISRELTHDIQLKNYVIPAGVEASIHIYDLHRDPNFWPDPLRYDPDRFLPEQIQGRHPFSYIPFSAGPRNCIGQKFGMMELKTIIGHLIYNFYLEPIDLAHEIRISMDLVLRPKTMPRIKFVPR